MNLPTLTPWDSVRQPEKGAKAALLTAKGVITGVIISWNDGGAVVEASGEVQVGSVVKLRVQGPDRIWEKRASVLWVNKGQSFGLEFEQDGPTQKNRGILARLQQLLPARVRPPANNRSAQAGATVRSRKELPEKHPAGGRLPEERRETTDKRRRRRFQIEAAAQITWPDCAVVGPEVAAITDASSHGVLFTTKRDYPVGTKLQVRYPYPNSTSPLQEGDVVRVEVLADGQRRVAVAFA